MNTNKFSTTILFSHEKPYIVNGQFDKFETLLFLPPNQGRIAEGGLREKGNFKHSYKYIVNNHCSGASGNSSMEASEGKNKSTAGIFYSGVAADDKIEYTKLENKKIDLSCKTDTGRWYICDTDGNPVKPVSADVQEKIEGYIKSVQDNINCDIEKTDKDEYTLQKSIKFLPLITVITVVFNGVKTLEETIKSVINQTYPNVEYLIIDGGSTDGTLDIIKKYEDVIDYWVSEPDKGIYDAMNKGATASLGYYVYFMGSDDILVAISLSSLFAGLKENSKQLIALPVLIGRKRVSYPDISLPVPVIHHQGAIFNLSNLKQLGLYSSEYIIHADFKLMNEYVSKFGVKYINIPICNFNKGGKSTNGANAFISIKEMLSIYFRYGGNILSFKKWMMFILRPLYYLLRRPCN